MAQTWPSGFCAHKACDATKTIPFKFTIHGLWPSNYSIPQPSLCSSTGLNISLISGIVHELDQDWPNYLWNNNYFWNSEWMKHGTCSNMLPFDYFRLTLDIYARNDLQQILEHANILPGSTYLTSQIIATIKTSPIGVEPQVSCRSKDLVEIRLCLNKSPIPHYINCPKPRLNCPNKVNFL
ncbi:ribonuclease Phyb-like [Vigna unguiculata]|uniref:ribonuclease Phyb-like n=1 Tax=Vigna unguiculata TaxID=3917 RepID=UPI0010170056|nr:ribonuclease Phyb-like [Vigna unguiculata]XP_027930364.1 ribonuclease Phyb-like [Vigna unguiculata]